MSDIVLTPINPGDDADADVLMANFNTLKTAVGDVSTYVDGEISTFGNTVSNIQSTLSGVSNSYVPVGTVIWFADESAPDGFLICNGTAVSRTEYSDLFEVIGTTFGEGNGETTFNIPDLITTYNHVQGSATVGTQLAAGVPEIWGAFCGIEGSGHTSGAFYQGGTSSDPANGSGTGDSYVNFAASRCSGVYGSSTTVQPPSTTLLPCIKY